LAKAVTDPAEEVRRAMAVLDGSIRNLTFQQENAIIGDAELVERVGKVNLEKNALRERLPSERQQFRLDDNDRRLG
jgi:hypothetical protein